MALNRYLWPAVATGMGLLLVALLPPRASEEAARYRSLATSPYQPARWQVERELVRTETQLYFERRAADAIRTAAEVPADGPILVSEPAVPAAATAFISTTLADQWQRLGIGEAFVPTIVSVDLDSSRVNRESSLANLPRPSPVTRLDIRTRLVAAETGPACVMLITMNADRLAMALAEAEGLARLFRNELDLGPCAFASTYGAPGRAIARWLDEAFYGPALQADWAGTSDAVVRPRPGPASQFWASGYVPAAACAAGRTDQCRAVLFEPAGREATRGWRTTFWWRVPFNAPDLLSDVVRDVGPETFGRFWRSEEAPAAAFRAATGQDLGRWLSEWAQRRFGVQEASPRIAGLGAVAAVLFSLLAGAAGAAINHRRR